MRRNMSFWDRAKVASFWGRGAVPSAYSTASVFIPPPPSNIDVSFTLPPSPMLRTRSASSAIANLALTASTSRWIASTLCSKSRNTSQKYGLGIFSILSTWEARTFMICCRASASMLVIPDRFKDEAGAPPPALVTLLPAGAAPPSEGVAVEPALFLLDKSPTSPLILDRATPLLAATFSTGHAPCIFACTAASPARNLRVWASIRLVSAD
mmetsp:Transcript_13742/g.29530  ORF Transcript_13742/g.29530 Transcript_13742/m.29530 type:complete len:211 (-) Transcript_13742:156-788(-)